MTTLPGNILLRNNNRGDMHAYRSGSVIDCNCYKYKWGLVKLGNVYSSVFALLLLSESKRVSHHERHFSH